MQIFAIVLSFALTVAAVAMLVPAVRRMLGVIRSGQPAPGRSDNPAGRTATMLKETFLHTRMLQWHWVGIMHWFVYAAFLFLSTAVLAAYFQLFKPDFAWPLIGHWYPYEWFSELIGLLSTVGIVFLIVYRQKHHPRSEGRRQPLLRLDLLAGLLRRGAGAARGLGDPLRPRAPSGSSTRRSGAPTTRSRPGSATRSTPSTSRRCDNLIYVIAAFKIALAMIWLMVIARNITMGIAWHRFTAWFNICFKREPDGTHRARRDEAADLRAARRSPSTTSTTSTRTRCSASARSRTSPGRASSTSPPAPSAAAASRSAPPGTPRSRSPPSS